MGSLAVLACRFDPVAHAKHAWHASRMRTAFVSCKPGSPCSTLAPISDSAIALICEGVDFDLACASLLPDMLES